MPRGRPYTGRDYLRASGLERAPHVSLVKTIQDNPEKFAVEVALTGSGIGNIARGSRMSYAGIRAIQQSSYMRAGFPKAFAAYKGAMKITKGSRISRRGKAMLTVGGIEMTLDPDIPFVPFF